jgi:hypothetical protein
VAEAVVALNRGACRKPSRLLVKKDGQFDRIVKVEFTEEKPTRVAELVTPVNDWGDEVPF